MQEHLLTFEQQWTDEANGRTLPGFVTDELHGFMSCGILGRGFAHLFCKTCHEHHAVAFSCKARAVCPSCLGRRMNEGALNLTDYVLPDVPLRQFVLTMPFPLRFPLAFDGKLLGQVVRIFTDTVAGWYRKRHVERGLPPGETGAVTVATLGFSPPTQNGGPWWFRRHRPSPPPRQGRKTLATPCLWPSPKNHDRPPIAAATSPGNASCASSASTSKPVPAAGAR